MEQIILENVEHVFYMGKVDLPVLFGIDLVIHDGEFVSLCGSSGSGKSTLLNLMGGLMKATSGRIQINGHDIGTFDENQLCHFRQQNLGFIFQSYNLLPALTALENVELPLIFAAIPAKERRERAAEMLTIVGLEDRMEHRPNEMSGGQQQRVAIARALVSEPPIILADEPTGNLDSVTGSEIIQIMRDINQNEGKTFVMVTHDLEQAQLCERIIHLKDGLITGDEVLS